MEYSWRKINGSAYFCSAFMHACVCAVYVTCLPGGQKRRFFLKMVKMKGSRNLIKNTLMNIPKYACILISLFVIYLLLKLVLNRLPVFLDLVLDPSNYIDWYLIRWCLVKHEAKCFQFVVKVTPCSRMVLFSVCTLTVESKGVKMDLNMENFAVIPRIWQV
jgi:hypothetical protein